MIRSRPVVGQRPAGGRAEHGPLLEQPAEQPVGRRGDLVAGENADQLIDVRDTAEQALLVAFRQAAGDDHAAAAARALQPQHLLDRLVRFLAGVADESAGVDDHQIGPVRLADQPVAVQLQQPGHPLAVDEVLRAAEADQGVGALGGDVAAGDGIRGILPECRPDP